MNAIRKKVLMLLTNAFDPDPRVHNEAKSLVKHGYEVRIVCWDRDRKNTAVECIDGIFVERIYLKSTHGRGLTQVFFLPLFWIKTFFRVFKDKLDIVHCHDFDTLPLGYILAKFKKAKLIYDAHESFSDMLSNSLPGWFIKALVAFENFFIKRVDMLITVGTIIEDFFKKRGAKKTAVVGNWKDPKEFVLSEEEKQEIRQKLSITNGQLIFSYIGWFNKERKLDVLLEAVAATKDIRFLIGGDGPDRYLVEEYAKKYSNITYLGYVKAKDIPGYTAISDAIVYTYKEDDPNARFSAPNKLFEALAAGKPIITGNFGEIAKIVREEQCGVVLEPLNSETLREAFYDFSTNGKFNVYQDSSRMAGQNKYNWQKAEKVLEGVYKRLGSGLLFVNKERSIRG
jgi:glycosyltransferase involved in cell wall biosynthesis